MSQERRIRKAVESWFITEPLLFLAWMTHRLVERPGIATLRVGEGRLEYNPAFVASLPDRALAEVLRLEAVRIVLRHPYQRRPADPEVAYLASNLTLREHVPTRLSLPTAREVFGDPAHDRQYYEYYCDRLSERGGAGRQDGGAATPGGDAPGGGRSGEAAAAAHFEPGQGGENAQLWQEDALAQEEIRGLIQEAEQSDGWGSVPGALKAAILASLRPRLDYRRVLRHFRTSILSSRRELTRMKPSRRYGFAYMGSRHRLCSRLLCAVDVSGSITEEEIALAYSVINRLFQYGIEAIDVLQFDTRITGEVETLRRARQRVEVHGRGGTDFAPVLAYLDGHPEYDGMIIITDGDAARPPATRSRAKVLWLFNHERTYERMRQNVAHVGRAVYIKSG